MYRMFALSGMIGGGFINDVAFENTLQNYTFDLAANDAGSTRSISPVQSVAAHGLYEESLVALQTYPERVLTLELTEFLQKTPKVAGLRGGAPNVIPPSYGFLSRFPMPIAETFPKRGAGAAVGGPEHLFVDRVGLFYSQPGDQVLA